jgi:hypothetical protein
MTSPGTTSVGESAFLQTACRQVSYSHFGPENCAGHEQYTCDIVVVVVDSSAVE